jgi:FAD dependent oxidoreductase
MSTGYKLSDDHKVVTQLESQIPIVDRVDVVVAGGGVAGLSAAIGSGRTGAKTLLIEGQGFIGGIATASLMTLWTIPSPFVNGIAREIYEGLYRGKGAVLGKSVPFHPEAFKVLSLRMLHEASVKLLFYTWVVDAIKEGNRVVGLVVENKSGRQAILANCIVDTTGDADVIARSGAPWVKGRETDSKMRPVTLMFRMENVDIDKISEYRDQQPGEFSPDPGHNALDKDTGLVRLDGFFTLTEAARTRGEIDKNCHYLRLHGIVRSGRGVITINSTRIYNVDGTSTEDLTQSYLEGERQIQQLVNFLQKHVPGFEESSLLDSAPSLGVRETRRIRGEYVLSEDEIATPIVFPDAIARVYGHVPTGVEIHSPDAGEGGANDPYVRGLKLEMREFFVPYRSLVPLQVDGLLVGGRCISVTHEADSSTRTQPVCMATGQAAGIAAGIGAQRGVQPRQLNVHLIQQELLRQGVDLGRITS